MSYETLFQRYGSPSTDAEIRVSGYLLRPDRLKEPGEVKRFDESAARIIAECYSLIDQLKEYRQDLAARYAQLETMPYTERVELKRYRNSISGISYYVRIVRRYEDGTEIDQLTEKYPGKERHKAIKRFEEIQKQRPGIEAVKDIEKRKWER